MGESEEFRDGRENPRPGDVLRKVNKSLRPTERIVLKWYSPGRLVTYRAYRKEFDKPYCVDIKTWRKWAAHAMVVRHGGEWGL